ncbi:MAG: hemolysin III family protein [Verrucomicrobiota bacterium]|nr:hemolysin III family protein [Verrucomicrobiota bacterium]MDQ3545818.1 hemolysin III family protein [Verrucomicrobiota bacterium]
MSATPLPCNDPKWDQSLGEELANSISHGLGLLAGLVGAPMLMFAAWRGGDRFFFVGTAVFTAAMLLVYLGSTLYHAWPRGAMKSVFQVIDHSAIFLLIAGTYTPFTLGPLRGPWGWTILGLVWGLAIFGVILKSVHGTQQRKKLSLALYLGMGWLIVLAFRPLLQLVPLSSLAWLVAGGLAYTGGVFFFVSNRRRYTHFVWHLFVLLGTACHFLAVFSCAAA